MSSVSVTFIPHPGRPGSPVAVAGTERECAKFIDMSARVLRDRNVPYTVEITTDDRRCGARLGAYARFARFMEQLDREMFRDFDYRNYLAYTSPKGESR